MKKQARENIEEEEEEEEAAGAYEQPCKHLMKDPSDTRLVDRARKCLPEQSASSIKRLISKRAPLRVSDSANREPQAQ